MEPVLQAQRALKEFFMSRTAWTRLADRFDTMAVGQRWQDCVRQLTKGLVCKVREAGIVLRVEPAGACR